MCYSVMGWGISDVGRAGNILHGGMRKRAGSKSYLQLLVEPAFSSGIKGDREANRHFRADADPPVQDARQCLKIYAKPLRGRGDS